MGVDEGNLQRMGCRTVHTYKYQVEIVVKKLSKNEFKIISKEKSSLNI